MSHTPSTFRGESGEGGIEWDRPCTLHHAGEEGVLADLKAARHGTLADLVRYVALLSESARKGIEIGVAGDHRLPVHEIMALYNRADFPHAG